MHKINIAYRTPEMSHGISHVTNPYYAFKSLLTPEQCELVVNWGKEAKLDDGSIMDSNNVQAVTDFRVSKVTWLPLDQFEWLYDLVFKSCCLTNYWEYDLTGFFELMQYTEYDAAEAPAYYKWHSDVGLDHNHRKISVTVALNDGEEYVGGQLRIHGGADPDLSNKGSAVIFPSFTKHEVVPVTSGIRRSLVAWVSGPKLR